MIADHMILIIKSRDPSFLKDRLNILLIFDLVFHIFHCFKCI